MNLNLQKSLRGAEIRMLFLVKKFAFLGEESYFIKHMDYFYISTVIMKTGYYFVLQVYSSSSKLLLVGHGSTQVVSQHAVIVS